MQGMTHMAMGCAATLLIMRPKTIPELFFGIGVASIGTVISDLDADSSISRRKADQIMGYAVGVTAVMFALEYIFKLGILSLLLSNFGVAKTLVGLLGFTIICLFGKGQDHRTFMHSLLAMIALSGCVYLVVPEMAAYFMIAFASHLILDYMNYQGIQLFYPLNPRVSLDLCKSDGLVNSILGLAGSGIFVLTVIVLTVRCLL